MSNDNRTDDLDSRIRAALRAKAGRVGAADLRPAVAPAGTRRRTWLAPSLAAAAALVVAVATAAIVHASDGHSHPVAAASLTMSATARVQAPSPVAPSPTPSSGSESPTPRPVSPTPTAITTPTATSGGTLTNCDFVDFACPVPSSYVYEEPLWPFATWVQAKQWQNRARLTGQQPWHLDAGETALDFTRNYLGFTDITMVTYDTTTIPGYPDGPEAMVGVGYRSPNGKVHTAALLQLIRFSPNSADLTAPWEVVGTDTLVGSGSGALGDVISITSPRHGTTVHSPTTVRGQVTGVDENITVAVRTLSGPVSTMEPVAAGGTNVAWSVRTTFPETGVLTIVASTGGHTQQHEEFAVLGVQTAS